MGMGTSREIKTKTYLTQYRRSDSRIFEGVRIRAYDWGEAERKAMIYSVKDGIVYKVVGELVREIDVPELEK